ncbi:hypothetical protein NKR23_g4354 [Pleurostoma richardsiae]|uniref:Oxidase ustYa n=1 Tax=Pleurostoma richardsiae TaxID=41990 RepID=A0AA38RW13_9PEZI|nr:hypothetical protein NKR23_g4354 [Pleurostoma richardsiae]
MDSKHHVYDTVSITDDPEESMSNTEVDESLMGDEKQWHPSGTDRRQRRKSTILMSLRSYRWLIDAAFLLVIVALLALLLLQERRRDASSASWQVGGDYSGAGPQFPTKIVKFEADMSFSPMNSSEFFEDKTLALWNTLMPAGTGYGTENQTFFTTSMTHQLHCVYMMARIYSGVVANMSAALPDDYHFHFLHCVDYMRQAVMCSADLAMEPHEPSDSDDMGPADGGWNGHHVCKDYKQVIGYLEGQIADGVRVVLPIDD